MIKNVEEFEEVKRLMNGASIPVYRWNTFTIFKKGFSYADLGETVFGIRYPHYKELCQYMDFYAYGRNVAKDYVILPSGALIFGLCKGEFRNV